MSPLKGTPRLTGQAKIPIFELRMSVNIFDHTPHIAAVIGGGFHAPRRRTGGGAGTLQPSAAS